MEIIGLDVGFGFTKATNGRGTVVFKSVLGEAAEIQFREAIPGGPGAEEHLHLIADGAEYFAGDLAERQSAARSFTLDHDKLIAELAKPLALAALGQIASGRSPIRLVVGLPINQYRRHRERVVATLTGTHPVVLIDAQGARRELTLAVQQVRVVPQPYGTLFDLVFAPAAPAPERRFAEQKVGLVDVGFRTTDLTIADRTRYSERGSRTLDAGISQAFASLAAKLQERSGVDVELYRLFEAVTRGSIKIRGKSYDLRGLTEKVFAQLASRIATDVERLWADDWDLDATVVTGGGGAVIGAHLAPLLAGEVIVPPPGTDARTTNVTGYWKYGKSVWGQAERTAMAAVPGRG